MSGGKRSGGLHVFPHRDAGHLTTRNGGNRGLNDPGQDVLEVIGLVEVSGDLSEGHGKTRRRGAGLAPFGRLFPGSGSRVAFALPLVPLLSRQLALRGGAGPLCCATSLLHSGVPGRDAQPRSTLLDAALSLVEFALSL